MKPDDDASRVPAGRKPLFLFNPSFTGQLVPPGSRGMRFETEGGLDCRNPPWGMVESALGLLDAGEGNSFAILSTPNNNAYVQTLRGHNGFHLEWRITGDTEEDHIHYRASDPTGSAKPALLRKTDGVNEGRRADLLWLDRVVEAFRAFFHREGPPPGLSWRRIVV